MNDVSGFGAKELETRIKELEVKLAKSLQAEKEAKEALRECENRFQAILDLSPDSIVIVNYEGVLVDVNKRFCDWTGFSKEELIASPPMRPPFLSPETKKMVVEVIKRRLSGEEVPPYEIPITTKSGDTVFGEVHATVLYDALGVAIADLIILHNVTERNAKVVLKDKRRIL